MKNGKEKKSLSPKMLDDKSSMHVSLGFDLEVTR